MKVEKEFKPVTITLETEKELTAIRYVCNYAMIHSGDYCFLHDYFAATEQILEEL